MAKAVYVNEVESELHLLFPSYFFLPSRRDLQGGSHFGFSILYLVPLAGGNILSAPSLLALVSLGVNSARVSDTAIVLNNISLGRSELFVISHDKCPIAPFSHLTLAKQALQMATNCLFSFWPFLL